ncbi:MAG: DUF1295 domain-containing protein [Bacteroidales bacterium]|jgi:steroid 5-alpha reductase family enzyme|nr:DUF1295 domain-containing protein [Bacteroidales bacterium]
MGFFDLYFQALVIILSLMVLAWLISITLTNASIVDSFWGLGFVVVSIFYFFQTNQSSPVNQTVFLLVSLWGLRLTIYITLRNWGKGEDYRYQNFRQKYGPKRYWWFSFFQVFLLQGILLWLISATLLGTFYPGKEHFNFMHYLALTLWVIGFTFEAGGDLQLSLFKSKPENKGKLLTSGFWKYTRHPNYFGDAAVWWSYGLFSIASGQSLPVLGSVLMTLLLIRVSGVALLEKNLIQKKPGYKEYIQSTSAFIPWVKKKTKHGKN